MLTIWNCNGYDTYTLDSAWPTGFGDLTDTHAVAAPTLVPGAGAFFLNYLGHDLSITFSGNPIVPVPIAPLPCGCGTGHYNLLSRPTPGIGTYENITGLLPQEGAQVLRWLDHSAVTLDFSYFTTYTFHNCLWSPAVPTAAVGESVFVLVPCTTNPPCPCPPVPFVLFNTGVDAGGAILTNGAVDPHFTLTTNPNGNGTNAFVITGNGLTNTSTSKWIRPVTAGNSAGGTYVYHMTFNLPCTNNPIIIGQWAVDNSGSIQLNGTTLVDTIATTDQSSFATWHPFAITTGLHAGQNTLDFYVTNIATSATGLRVELTGTATCCPTNPCAITMNCPIASKTVLCGSAWNFDAPSNIVDPCCTNYSLTFSTVTNSGPCPLVTTRTWLISDVCGNTNTCSQTVTVVDTTAPVITCPSNMVVSTCSTNAAVTYTVTATDNCCTNVTIGCNPPSGYSFPLGTTTVSCTATDCCGNVSTCTFNVTVASSLPPLSWTTRVPMITGRYQAAAELLPSGRVLVVGGVTATANYSTAAEVFDPALNGWSSGIPALPQPHRFTAVRLTDGRGLVAGDDSTTAYTAYLYQETPPAWFSAGTPNSTHIAATLTRMNSGNILMAGGYCGGLCATYNTAEIYKPSLNTWTMTNQMINTRYYHTATLLPSGKVLVTGGAERNPLTIRAECELFDEVPGTWSAAATMNQPRLAHTATLLPNGKVLVVGGITVPTDVNHYTATVEIYDPAQNSWTPAASLGTRRAIHTATLLACGKVLITGGQNETGVLSSCELYDYLNNSWSATTSMSVTRTRHTATLLQSGQVFVTGGSDINGVYLASSEIYTPACCCGSAKTVACGTVWSFDVPSVADLCSGYHTNPVVLSTLTNGLCPQVITRTWLFTNDCGYSNLCSQTVTVTNTLPVIQCPTNIVVKSCTNVAVSYSATATGNCCTNVSVVYTPASGTLFAPGTTTNVHCVATDCCSNSVSCDFTVTVQCATSMSVTTSGNTVTLTWPTNPSYPWYLQSATNLKAGTYWETHGWATNPPVVWPRTNFERYFRLFQTN